MQILQCSDTGISVDLYPRNHVLKPRKPVHVEISRRFKSKKSGKVYFTLDIYPKLPDLDPPYRGVHGIADGKACAVSLEHHLHRVGGCVRSYKHLRLVGPELEAS